MLRGKITDNRKPRYRFTIAIIESSFYQTGKSEQGIVRICEVDRARVEGSMKRCMDKTVLLGATIGIVHPTTRKGYSVHVEGMERLLAQMLPMRALEMARTEVPANALRKLRWGPAASVCLFALSRITHIRGVRLQL